MKLAKPDAIFMHCLPLSEEMKKLQMKLLMAKGLLCGYNRLIEFTPKKVLSIGVLARVKVWERYFWNSCKE